MNWGLLQVTEITLLREDTVTNSNNDENRSSVIYISGSALIHRKHRSIHFAFAVVLLSSSRSTAPLGIAIQLLAYKATRRHILHLPVTYDTLYQHPIGRARKRAACLAVQKH